MQICTKIKRITAAMMLAATGVVTTATVFADEPIGLADENTQNAALTEAREAIVKRLTALQSLRGHFTQTLKAKDGKELQKTTGSFTFKRPGFYRWESNDPYPQIVVGNGTTVWVYDPDLEQVTISKQEAMPYNPANLLSGGIADLASRYHVLKNQDQGLERFTLIPLDAANAPFVQLGVNFVGDVLQVATLTDRLGQVTHIAFAETQVNLKVDDDLFTFVSPEGTDILMND